jgi:hypothetical protein
MRPGMAVAEVSVGGGEYSEWPVQHGCRVHLIDVSARLLETAAAKAARGFVGSHAGIGHGSVGVRERTYRSSASWRAGEERSSMSKL